MSGDFNVQNDLVNEKKTSTIIVVNDSYQSSKFKPKIQVLRTK